jgi:predicted SnoaL-like aldol condensation-catalyzing enzyme
MSGQDNKTVVRRYYEEVFNECRIGLIDQIAVEDYVEHDPFPG